MLVLVVCVPRVGGFVSLSNFGPSSVLGLVVPRGVGFILSRFGLVFGCVCGGFVLFLPPFGAWYWFPQAKSGKFALYTIRV